MSTSSATERITSVPGELHCLAPESTLLRRFTAPEALLFVFHDSDHGRAWRVLHSGFRDPTVETAVPRHSIECRTFAFFH